MPEHVDLQTIPEGHPKLRAKDWYSPLAIRLLAGANYRDAENEQMSDSFRAESESIPQNDSLLFRWKGIKEDFEQCCNTYQDPDLTEMAALAVACALMTNRAKLEITEVTRRGDRADYWIGDRESMLEVSGQQQGNLEKLRDEKADQLLDNPYGKSGFVCVSNFAGRQAYLWHYEAP